MCKAMPPDTHDLRKIRFDVPDERSQSPLEIWHAQTRRVRSSLPFPPSSFIGRTRELREIQHALTDTRLLTLTGAGGTGKTRLALEAAHRLTVRFADGATFITFDSIADPRARDNRSSRQGYSAP